MSELRAIDVQETAALAEAALAGASRRTVTLEKVQVLGEEHRRNFIARASAVSEGHPPRSVILKVTRSPTYDPGAENAFATSGLVKEYVAAAYLAAHAPARGHGSALLAGDVPNGLLIFADLGSDLRSLVDPLLDGTAAEAEQALTRYATALARLHADTAGCLDAHHEVFQSIFGAGRPRRSPGWRVEKDAEAVIGLLGAAIPAGELDLLSARLMDPGPWLSLIHGDPCPDNALLVDESVCLIDYEFARPAHALLDGIYWRIGFPTCWCAGRISADVAARVEVEYRRTLGQAVPAALDDETYSVELAYLAAVWLFSCLAWRLDGALKDDARWGIWSIRGRLVWYLEAVIAMTAAAGVLPGINKAASHWLAELRRRWPDAEPLALYPAFRHL